MFVGQIWAKCKSNSQHQLEEVEDWAAYLEHLQSILLEFDADCALGKDQLSRTFCDSLKFLIKLWVTKVDWQHLSWDDLVSETNSFKTKAHIYGNTQLDQQCSKEKRPLKISINSRDQLEKAQKSSAASHSQDKANHAK